MRKVRIFWGHVTDVEREINSFLSSIPSAEVLTLTSSAYDDSGHGRVIVTIFYKS